MSRALCLSVYNICHNSSRSLCSHGLIFFIANSALIIYGSSMGCFKFLFLFEIESDSIYHLLCRPGHSPKYHYYRHVWMFMIMSFYWIRNYSYISIYGFNISKCYFFKYSYVFYIWSRMIIYEENHVSVNSSLDDI